MANITKRDLVIEVSHATGYSQSEIRVVVEEFLQVSKETLLSGDCIELRKFGTFLTKERKPRAARNPRTGESVALDKSIAPLFKFSSDLKKRIESNLVQEVPSISVNNNELALRPDTL